MADEIMNRNIFILIPNSLKRLARPGRGWNKMQAAPFLPHRAPIAHRSECTRDGDL